MPVGVSLAVHAALLLIIATITWTVAVDRPARHAIGEISIELDNPAPSAGVPTNTPALQQPPAPIMRASVPSRSARAPVRTSQASAPAITPISREKTEIAPALRRGGISFAGVSAERATSIVYVVDTSGAMASSYTLIINELERSIARLDPSQLFQVISFRDRSLIEPGQTTKASLIAGTSALIPASAHNRVEAVRWLRERVIPSGRSDPAPALDLALSLDPDAIFLLTRSIRRTAPGRDDDAGTQDPSQPWSERWRDTLLARLEKLNPRVAGTRQTIIKAIQFIDQDPTGTLQAIGEAHGGNTGYVVRNREDLQQLARAPPPPVSLLRQSVERARAHLDRIAATSADWRVLFAYPTPQDLSDVTRAARAAIAELSPTDKLEDAIAQLYLARAAILLAHANTDDRPDALHLAQTTLARLADSADERIRWHRDHLAALLATLRQTRATEPPAPAWGSRDLLFEHALSTVTSAPVDEAEDISIGLLASLTRPPFSIQDAQTDPALLLLAVDAIANRAIKIARTSTPTDPTWTRFAIAQILTLRAHQGLARDPAKLEALILDRVSRLLDPTLDLRKVQPEATLAHALRLLDGQDPRSAETWLREILVRDDADHLAPHALVALTDLLAGDTNIHRRAQAPAMLMLLHDGWTDSREADGAVQRALFLSRDILASANANERASALNHYQQILRDAKQIDGLQSAPYWFAQHDTVLLELAKLHNSVFSLHLLEQIRPGSPEGPEAIAMYRPLVRTAIAEMIELHHTTRGVPGREEDAEVSLEAAERHARTALALYKAHAALEDSAPERKSLATVYNLMGRPAQELATLRELLPYLDNPDDSRPAVLLRIATLEHAQGQEAQAFARLRELTEQSQSSAEEFWPAWTLLLEILRENNPQGERTGTIKAHIAMLQTLDEQLAGDPWQSRILDVLHHPVAQ